MEVTISRIGNSDGIILPKSIMKRYSLHRAEVLVIDEDCTHLTLRKKPVPRKYEGPNTGFFAELSEIDGIDKTWGGEISSEDYLAELRRGENEKNVIEGLL